jgi:hypothetical protein
MERLPIPIACDLSISSLRWALDLLVEAGPTTDISLRVHSADENMARGLMYDFGWKNHVIVDEALERDEWILRGDAYEIHSPGA